MIGHAAQLEPFVKGGRFANRLPTTDHRLRALARPRRRRARIPKPVGANFARTSRAIEKEARLMAARRWIPINPLLLHAMRAEDAIRGR